MKTYVVGKHEVRSSVANSAHMYNSRQIDVSNRSRDTLTVISITTYLVVICISVTPPDVLILQVFGWNTTGTMELNDVFCGNNTAAKNGGCFYAAGRALINNGTVMLDNVAELGGCICEDTLNASVVCVCYIFFLVAVRGLSLVLSHDELLSL